MSSDGAMVPLVGGVWAEVKLVAIGAVERRRHNLIGAQGIHFYALREFTDRLFTRCQENVTCVLCGHKVIHVIQVIGIIKDKVPPALPGEPPFHRIPYKILILLLRQLQEPSEGHKV